MVSDFFAPTNLVTTLLCLAALVAAGVIQYLLSVSSVRRWLRLLPMLLCGGAVVLFLILFFVLLPSNSWHALSWLFGMLFAVLLLIACALGQLAACLWRRYAHKKTPRS